MALRIGNAPCSWGTLEFEGIGESTIGYEQMLDELVATGYTGTELGDWGFMSTDPALLRQELVSREITMLGGFVPVALSDPTAHEPGLGECLKITQLLQAVGSVPAPFLVLADDNGAVPLRTGNAGRARPDMALTSEQWTTFAQGVNRIARAVYDETGIRTVFHHHCAGYIETPDEIARLLDLTDPQVVGLVFDTGHFVYGSGGMDVSVGLSYFAERIEYVHLKDCHGQVAQQARERHWDYFRALREGVFCELGQGMVDFPAVLEWLRSREYHGYAVVEQDLLPGMGTPKESARRNREYLRSLGF